MMFQSLEFLAFFLVVCLAYYLIPGRGKKYWLLVASWVFYLGFSPFFGLYLGGITLLSWAAGLMLGRRRSRGALALAVVATLAALAVVKYGAFARSNLQALLDLLGASRTLPALQFAQPIGLSYFTFEAVGYLVDVWQGKRPAQRDLASYALYLAFFPTILSGPIERSTGFLCQVERCAGIRFEARRVCHGLLTMLYGYFLKLVIADRLNMVVGTVFDHYQSYGGCVVVLAAVGFGVQLYCDFAGISTIALGAGEVMGFALTDNFNCPYLSRSVAEFWRRWHISLSSWFRDYLYIPLGGNRKGKLRKYVNVMVVFLVSGLWHGAGWNYVVWGGLNGLYQVLGDLLKPLRKKLCGALHIDPENGGNRFWRTLFTFGLVNFAWIFFRAPSLRTAVGILAHAWGNWQVWQLFNGTLFTLGLDRPDTAVLCVALALLALASAARYRGIDWKDRLLDQGFAFRCAVYVVCIVAVVVFGIYGPGYDAASFIYVDF